MLLSLKRIIVIVLKKEFLCKKVPLFQLYHISFSAINAVENRPGKGREEVLHGKR